ncbi:MAG: amino acid adenylation domain-containing protein [Polyangiaceae bacterium]|nr:amino acid adenylation domain-containing protein [Polyangiaceae bacterium]
MKPYLLHQLLDASAERTPDAIALIEPKRTLTYAELAGLSHRIARALVDGGGASTPTAVRGAPVGLWSEKTSAAISAVYGILRAGAAYVPIDPATPPARAAQILRKVEARYLVTTADRVEMLYELKRQGELPSLEHLVLLSKAESLGPELSLTDGTIERGILPTVAITDGFLAYVLHTSGSTGKPKGVAITHRNALAFVEPATDHFAITAADRLACQAPVHFDLSVFDLYCASLAGAAVVSLPEYFSAFPKKMAGAVREHGVTIWNSVVSALGLLVDKGLSGAETLPSLRAVIFSGERMPIPLLRRVRDRAPNAKLFNVYGQTEANSSLVHEVAEIPADDGAALPLGTALPNFDVFLLDEQQRPVTGSDVEGELCVRAATVAAGGYFREPALTAEKFVVDPELPDSCAKTYRTGDVVKRNDNGDLVFVGRRDNMIKTRGYRVELSEIEIALESIAGVAEVAVVAVPSQEIGHALHAFIQPAPGASLDAPAIDAVLRSKLPAYMVPETIAVREALPRTATGKIDRSLLKAERV